MRAWSVVETGAPLQALDMPTPEPKGSEVLVEVTHCGVCHSDLHIWEGGYDLGSRGKLSLKDRGVVLPLAMGHEIAGRVAALGPDAKGVAVGEAKVVYPWIGCGKCERCAADEDNMCPNQARTLGIYRNGGYATHVLVPDAKYLVPMDGADPAVAATYACSGITVYSAIRKLGDIPPDRPVVLVGAGGLGLGAIHMLRALGHRRIVSVDVSAEKLEAARKAGATETVLAEGDVTAAITAACGGPALAVIDLVNGSATARFAFDALGKGGTLVQVGLFGGEITVPLPIMAIRALALQGSYVGSPSDLRAVMALAKEGKLSPLPVSTAPMDQAGAVLERLRDGKVTGRVVLRADAA
ncbi:alcohol dehydrogenase [Roseomonas nepalensis]|uniref:alcohol dehydrogenase n=1 Tax=Muricoccus nepalensis TaxID=1854500 RepID=A0A502GCX6_9PROT|nr:alcohol dehydrogenase [Roseomonas nepalensis]TPG59785.1 alcohol dehydrogenase [Roseomonas nepalensis]